MKAITKFSVLFMLILCLSACGGGGESLSRDSDSNDDEASTDNGQDIIVLSLVDVDGNNSTTLADGSPLTINALVTNSEGSAVEGELVSFVLNNDSLASFDNDTGTALTDNSGYATIQLSVGNDSGSGTVSASTENAESVSIGFTSAGTQQQQPSSLELFASSTQLASSGSDEIELIAVVKNDQNILLQGVEVSFSANQNSSLVITDTETQDDGTARASLSTDNNQENRTITVSASTASLSTDLTIDVIGTEIVINGDSSVIIADETPITLVLSDSDGQGISNQTVTLSSNLGLIDNATPTTGENGQVTVNFSSDVSGIASITAQALAASAEFNITVQEDDFSFYEVLDDDYSLNQDHEITLRWFKDNSAYSNGDITITTSRGEISVGGISGENTTTTDSEGLANFTINSEFAGPASISAIGVDAEGNEVSSRIEIEFIASTVDSIIVDATPDLIGPEGQTSTITAVVRDEVGNLVKGKSVNFRLINDSSGGSINPNTAITDSNGIASTVYTSNAVSGDNGVTVGAESDGVESSTDLSVGDRAFDIVIGTGNSIEEEDSTTFTKEFAVFVTDASGRPVSDAELTASVVPTLTDTYYKGYWVWNDVDDIYVAVVTATCNSEDLDQDGLLDEGEDTNGDGELTPGNVATVNFADSVSMTDEFGQATLQVRYPQQYAVWSKVLLTVSGQSSGTESQATQEYSLAILASDLTTQSESPQNSPFGLGSNCDDTL